MDKHTDYGWICQDCGEQFPPYVDGNKPCRSCETGTLVEDASIVPPPADPNVFVVLPKRMRSA